MQDNFRPATSLISNRRARKYEPNAITSAIQDDELAATMRRVREAERDGHWRLYASRFTLADWISAARNHQVTDL